MKIVAISRVKNEVDIVEAFIRHNLFHCDQMIIADDGSTDGTWELLQTLRDQGANLVLMRETVAENKYFQSTRMTQLMHLAFNEFDADWAVPLDADEFLEIDKNKPLGEYLRRLEPLLYDVGWSSFVWAKNGDNKQLNPVERLRCCLRDELHPSRKIVIPRAIAQQKVTVGQGNHQLVVDGKPLPAIPLENTRLCHYPIRSIDQYSAKVAIAYLQYRRTPTWKEDVGYQHVTPFRLLASNQKDFDAYLEQHSKRYGVPDSVITEAELIENPLHYQGGPLTLTSAAKTPKFVGSLLQFAEVLARSEGVARSETSILMQRNRDLENQGIQFDHVVQERETLRARNDALTGRNEELIVNNTALAAKNGKLLGENAQLVSKSTLLYEQVLAADHVFSSFLQEVSEHQDLVTSGRQAIADLARQKLRLCELEKQLHEAQQRANGLESMMTVRGIMKAKRYWDKAPLLKGALKATIHLLT